MSCAVFAEKKATAPAPKAKTVSKAASASLHVGEPKDYFQRNPDRVTDEAVAGNKTRPEWSFSRINIQDPGEGKRDASEAASTASRAGAVPGSVRQVLQFPGKTIDPGTRKLFEGQFGQDFSRVRVHTDEQAAEAAGALHAAAFTVGSDIVFGRNRYSPASPRGRLLLLHELRHVEQQRYASRAAEPELDARGSSHEYDAQSLLDPNIEPLAVQRIQCAPEDEQFSLGGGVIDTVGKAAFGETAWPFLKAVFEGFVGGLKGDIKAGKADEAKDHLKSLFLPWNAAKFYGGYLVGLVIGLVSPITDLVKGIIGAVKLAGSALEWLAKWSPVGVAVSPERQQKILRLQEKFGELATEFAKSLVEFAANPKETAKKFSGFLDSLMQLALGEAHELGAKAAHSIFDFLKEDFFDMGESIGKVIGALVAQILLAVFSEAIGNLISEGASMLGKAAEFVAGKAVEVFEWVKGFASKVVSALRSALKGALKAFEGLANKAIGFFEELSALFLESEALDVGGEKVAAGVGRISGPPVPNVMESRMVSSTRTAPAKVADLTPPKVHPSNVASAQKALTEPTSTAEAVEDLERTSAGGTPQPGEAAAIGTEIERMEVQQWSKELNAAGYRTYARNEFGEARLGPQRASRIFTDQRARPDMLAIHDAKKTIIVGDVTASPGTTAKVPGLIGQEEKLHIEKTIEYARQLKRQLPPEFADYKVFAQDRFWRAGGTTKLIEVN